MEPECSLPQSQVPATCPYPELTVWMFCNKIRFYGEEMLAPRLPPKLEAPQAGGPPLVVCPRLLIQYIWSYPPFWRPFLHSQPENELCRGDRKLMMMIMKDKFERAQWDNKKIQNSFGPTAYRLMINAWELTAVKDDDIEV